MQPRSPAAPEPKMPGSVDAAGLAKANDLQVPSQAMDTSGRGILRKAFGSEATRYQGHTVELRLPGDTAE